MARLAMVLMLLALRCAAQSEYKCCNRMLHEGGVEVWNGIESLPREHRQIPILYWTLTPTILPNPATVKLCMALGPWDSCAEPDVPAIQETRQECKRNNDYLCPAGALGSACPCGYSYQPVKESTCADKSRILLTAEDGSKHCIKLK
jgi:hypothetical protein